MALRLAFFGAVPAPAWFGAFLAATVYVLVAITAFRFTPRLLMVFAFFAVAARAAAFARAAVSTAWPFRWIYTSPHF
jgi:hypothetical protein